MPIIIIRFIFSVYFYFILLFLTTFQKQTLFRDIYKKYTLTDLKEIISCDKTDLSFSDNQLLLNTSYQKTFTLTNISKKKLEVSFFVSGFEEPHKIDFSPAKCTYLFYCNFYFYFVSIIVFTEIEIWSIIKLIYIFQLLSTQKVIRKLLSTSNSFALQISSQRRQKFAVLLTQINMENSLVSKLVLKSQKQLLATTLYTIPKMA